MDGQAGAERNRWRIRCHPFGRGDRDSVGQVLIQAVTAEGATIVAPGGGFRLGPEELQQLARSSAEAVRAQRQQASVPGERAL